VDDSTIFFDFAQHVGEIDVRQRGDEIDARAFQTHNNSLRRFDWIHVSSFRHQSYPLNIKG